jgi:hypothetical protein
VFVSFCIVVFLLKQKIEIKYIFLNKVGWKKMDLPSALPFHLQVSVVITTTSKSTLNFELNDRSWVNGLSPLP